MKQEELALWIQVAAVVAALGAAVVALVVSAKDRKHSRLIAEEDRKAALLQAKLLLDLEALMRLLENRNRGGSSDRQESARLGAEALSLVGLIGRERIPRQWSRQVSDSDEALREYFDDPDLPAYKKDAIEAQLAVNGVLAEIKALLERP
jgi:hypothetical protein